jgi:DNA-binding NtrC family response regulator
MVQRETRILVIDDDYTIRETMAMILEQEGYTVDKAKDGKEAIEKSNTNLYHIAIVDWRLPDIEGTKLLGQLKKTIPKMRKIMLTGYPSMNNAICAVNEEADAFLTKPADVDLLLATIQKLLNKRAEEEEFSEEKVASFIETRIQAMQKENDTSQ